MAHLGRKGGVFHVQFRFNGTEYKKSLKTKDEAAASAAVHIIELTLHRSAACTLVWVFALRPVAALEFLRRFNDGGRLKWSERNLRHKIREAVTATDHAKPCGHLI